MAKNVRWIKPPKGMMRAIEQYGERALVATHALGVQVGTKMQGEARRNAPWEDRTGNARGGLFYAVDGFGVGTVEDRGTVRNADTGLFEASAAVRGGDTASGNDKTLIIVLGHTMFYGRFLELEHGGRYAIIIPTVEANLPVLQRGLDGLFSG